MWLHTSQKVILKVEVIERLNNFVVVGLDAFSFNIVKGFVGRHSGGTCNLISERKDSEERKGEENFFGKKLVSLLFFIQKIFLCSNPDPEL